jgi:hypothetical protein
MNDYSEIVYRGVDWREVCENANYALTTNPNKELNELRDRVSLLEAQLRDYRDELRDKNVEIRVLRSLLK